MLKCWQKTNHFSSLIKMSKEEIGNYSGKEAHTWSCRMQTKSGVAVKAAPSLSAHQSNRAASPQAGYWQVGSLGSLEFV